MLEKCSPKWNVLHILLYWTEKSIPWSHGRDRLWQDKKRPTGNVLKNLAYSSSFRVRDPPHSDRPALSQSSPMSPSPSVNRASERRMQMGGAGTDTEWRATGGGTPDPSCGNAALRRRILLKDNHTVVSLSPVFLLRDASECLLSTTRTPKAFELHGTKTLAVWKWSQNPFLLPETESKRHSQLPRPQYPIFIITAFCHLALRIRDGTQALLYG